MVLEVGVEVVVNPPGCFRHCDRVGREAPGGPLPQEAPRRTGETAALQPAWQSPVRPTVKSAPLEAHRRHGVIATAVRYLASA